MSRKNSHEFVESHYLDGNIKLLNVYVNADYKNDLECMDCNHLWKTTYNAYKSNNNGCPKCYIKSLALTQEFVESVYLKSKIKLLSVYVNIDHKNDLECMDCNHLWKATYKKFQYANNGCPNCWKLLRIGEKAPHWNPNLTNEEREQGRNFLEKREWVKAVYNRDNHTCQCCNIRGGTLNAHHIDSWKEHKDDRFNVDNGVTLCETCHKACHKYHNDLGYPTAIHDVFYHWIIRNSVIKPSDWLWIIRYPESMNERLKYFKI